jgi:hypothetical protein
VCLETLERYKASTLGQKKLLPYISPIHSFFYDGSSSPFRALAFYSVPYSFFTDGTTPWMSDQPVVGPLPKHRTTLTQNKRIHTHTHTHIPNIHVLSGIRTHDSRARASKDSSCLRPRGYCDRLIDSCCPLINGGYTLWVTTAPLNEL